MEKRTRIFAPEVLLEEYRRLLMEENVEALPLQITGGSMEPFLVGGRDTVYLSRLRRPPRRGDMLLYRRDSGAYILHRVFRAEAGALTFVGDAQWALERGVRPEQVIALVTRVERKGKSLIPGSFWWDFFEKIWIRMVPLRPAALWLGRLLRRIFPGRT